MRGPHFLPYLLLLPLGACLPLLDRSGPADAVDGIGAGESWGLLPEGRSPPFVGGFPLHPRALHQALIILAEELQALRRECVGSRLRREDYIREADFQSTIDTKLPMIPLKAIVEELKKRKRKKCGFKFRFGR